MWYTYPQEKKLKFATGMLQWSVHSIQWKKIGGFQKVFLTTPKFIKVLKASLHH